VPGRALDEQAEPAEPQELEALTRDVAASNGSCCILRAHEMAGAKDPREDEAKTRAEARVGTVIDGRYQLDRVLAMGGMGAVYVARHLKLKKRVAVKLLHPDVEQKVELVLRFEREAMVGAHVENRHVAAATDFGDLPDGTRYLVTEYVRGRTLRELLIAEAPMDPVRATRIVRQIATGLAEIHARGIVHRDLKPRNVMVTDGDFVKIIDFGLAKIEDARVSTIPEPGEGEERITGSGVIFGTIDYLAPEAAFGMEIIDHRADLYAVGVMFYEMITGKHPFDARTDAELFAMQRTKAPPPFRERAPDVAATADLEQVVMKLLEKDFDERYESAEALIAALDAACPAGSSTPDEPIEPPLTQRRPTSDMPPPLPGASLAPPSSGPASVTPASAAESQAKKKPPSRARAPAPKDASVPMWAYVVGAAVVALSVYLFYLWRESVSGVSEPPPARATGTPATAESTATATAVATATATIEPTAASTASAALSASAEPAPSASAAPVVDRDALRAALKAPLSEGRLDEAATAGLALLQGDPSALEDKATTDLVRELLVSLARDRHPRTDEVWRATATLQGERGPDMIFKILETRGRASWALRANDLLRDEEVQRVASPALRIAFALRDKPCNEKLELLDQAVTDGDGRAVTALDIVVRGCLKNAKVVDEALFKLRRRLDKN
jgi:serine/threonine-protein kinase